MRKTFRFLAIILILAISVSLFIPASFAVESGGMEIIPWDGSAVADSYAGGDGSEENPFIIMTAAQFAYFRDSINKGINNDKHYILGNDIHLGDKEWTNIGTTTSFLTGSFDGCGHTISNYKIVINVNTARAGLFGSAKSGALITDFKVSNATVTLGVYSGAWIGIVLGQGDGITLSKIIVDETCSIDAISGGSIGGIAGRIINSAVAEYCRSSAVINAGADASFVGGITGVIGSGATVRYCAFDGKINDTSADKSKNGGIAGIIGSGAASTIEYCYNTGEVNSSLCAGGVVGATNTVGNYIKNCYNISSEINGKDTTVSGSVIGGIVHVLGASHGNFGTYIENVGMYGTDVKVVQTVNLEDAFKTGLQWELLEKCNAIDQAITNSTII